MIIKTILLYINQVRRKTFESALKFYKRNLFLDGCVAGIAQYSTGGRKHRKIWPRPKSN